MFASRSTDIGSQLPLWAVQDDFTPGVDTVDTFMGGWTSAVAKQYNLGWYLEPDIRNYLLTRDQEQPSAGKVLTLIHFFDRKTNSHIRVLNDRI